MSAVVVAFLQLTTPSRSYGQSFGKRLLLCSLCVITTVSDLSTCRVCFFSWHTWLYPYCRQQQSRQRAGCSSSFVLVSIGRSIKYIQHARTNPGRLFTVCWTINSDTHSLPTAVPTAVPTSSDFGFCARFGCRWFTGFIWNQYSLATGWSARIDDVPSVNVQPGLVEWIRH